MNLTELQTGQKAIIDSFSDSQTALRLLELGCTPGEVVQIDRVAPFGDPIAISIAGYLLSLRKSEASTVMVSLLVANI